MILLNIPTKWQTALHLLWSVPRKLYRSLSSSDSSFRNPCLYEATYIVETPVLSCKKPFLGSYFFSVTCSYLWLLITGNDFGVFPCASDWSIKVSISVIALKQGKLGLGELLRFQEAEWFSFTISPATKLRQSSLWPSIQILIFLDSKSGFKCLWKVPAAICWLIQAVYTIHLFLTFIFFCWHKVSSFCNRDPSIPLEPLRCLD